MSLSHPERAVILSGPSGVGKDTVLDRWIELDPRIQRVVTCTTRSPREGEIHGVSYFFLSPEEFEDKAKNGEFLEFKPYGRNWYATPLSEIQRIMDEGGIAILKIDVQGALEVMEKEPRLTTIFLLPPSMEELERRIRHRGTESEDQIEIRLRTAKEEIENAPHYRHKITNNDVETTVETIMSLFGESK